MRKLSKLKMKTTATLMTILFLVSTLSIAFNAMPVQAYTGVNLVNGDFESPEVTHSDKWDVFASVPGWTVEWYGGSTSYEDETRPDPALLELHRGVNDWSPYSGEQYTELDTDWEGPGGSLRDEPASVKIYQDLETIAGGGYKLEYAWSPRPNHEDNELKVYWDGSEVGYHSGSGGNNTEWHLESYFVLATSSLTRLEFVEVGTPDGLGMFLDAVSVVPGELVLKMGAISTLQEIAEEYNNKRIKRAIKYVEKSVNPRLWVDESHLDVKKGKKVFDYEKKAVKELMHLIHKKNTPQWVREGCQTVIDDLVEADKLLVEIIYEEALEGAGDPKVDRELSKCEKYISKAEKELGKGRYDKAIWYYQLAWWRAQKALKYST